MILIALVLLIAVGPEQLPGLVRRAGQLMGQMRAMSDGLRRDFADSMDELERASDPRKWTELGVDDTLSTANYPVKDRNDADDPNDDVDDNEVDVDDTNVDDDVSSLDVADELVQVPTEDPGELDDEESSPITTDSGYDGLVEEAALEQAAGEHPDQDGPDGQGEGLAS